jgi:hypothetical protein
MPSLFKIFWELRKPENERDRAKIAEGAPFVDHDFWI